MKKQSTTIKSGLVILLIIFTCQAPLLAQQILDQVLAIVDDDIVLESEVIQAAYLLAMQLRVDPMKSPKEFERLKKETLENLINQKILLVQAEKDTIKADEEQVERYLQQQMQNIVQQLGGEDKVEEYFGAPIAKIRRNYREEIEKNLRIREVQNKKFQNLKIGRKEVEKFFLAYKDSIGNLKETVDISHILITPKPGEKAKKEAYNRISELRKRIINGEDFAQIAKTYSEDPGSAAKGGDLGLMTRGDFVRDFEEVAFALKINEISDIVQTQFGYHIIQLLERRGDKIRARHILITIKPQMEDEKAAADSIKKIYTLLQNGANFEELVEKYSEDVSSKDEKGYLGHFEIDQLRERAKEFVFAIKGVQPGQYTEPVKTSYGFHILRVEAREEARPLDLKKDYDRISRMALDHKMQQQFKKWIEELRQNIYVEIKPHARL